MKEHGLIFGARSMCGIVGGSKTMTRRVVTFDNSVSAFSRKTWNELDFDHAFVDPGPSPLGNLGPYLKVPFPKTDGFLGHERHDTRHRVYPRVQVGDVIRCKEAWRPVVENTRVRVADSDIAIEYKADGAVIVMPLPDGTRCPIARFSKKTGEQMWSSPAFMPRWVSRAFLPVTGVVAQRVHEILDSDVDFFAEGHPGDGKWRPTIKARFEDRGQCGTWFRELWDSLNAKRGFGWDANPWVWGYRWKEVI